MSAMTCSRVTPAFAVRMTITPVVVGEEAWAWATAELVIDVAPIRVKVSAKTALRSAFIVLVSAIMAGLPCPQFPGAGCILANPRSNFAIKAARASGCSFVVR
jgi:hypothetical protein